MSTKDKTREKLVESMRKTRTTVASETTEQPTETAKSTPAKPAAKKAPADTQSSADNYQSSRRVWPD